MTFAPKPCVLPLASVLGPARGSTDDHIRAWHLAHVRTEQDRTQEDIALSMGVTQPRVSPSTLRAYVRALGGKLRVVADFGDEEYRLT